MRTKPTKAVKPTKAIKQTKPIKLVPDTSVIVDGRITDIIGEKKAKGKIEIIIADALVSELEKQANQGRETGFDGLSELKTLREISKKSRGKITIKFQGNPVTKEDVKYARYGRIDELIRKIAEENNATLVTSDRVQALVSEATGISVRYIGVKVKKIEPHIFKLFDSTTMSLHLKENTQAFAKRGSVGNFELTVVGPKIGRDELEKYVQEIVESAQADPRGYLEMEGKGVTVIQLGKYRIVITRPPFSDGLEITAVKPIAKTKLSDYKLSKKLLERLGGRAEGMFIAGSPGHGKSTFAQALAEFYLGKGKVIKTMEHPRDLQVPDTVTQYIGLEGSMEKTADILLLVRPDYTIFDEVRKTRDFQIFADMRLAGVGMIGVTHASRAIDAVQRLVGRVDLGVIPHIVDTIIFIEAGKIREVYELKMTVKVPHGMREADLARPVIEVTDFETGSPRYELYSYGEEVVVIPTTEFPRTSPARARGRREAPRSGHNELSISKTKKLIIIRSGIHRDEFVSIFINGEEISTARVNKAGNMKIKRNTELGRILHDAINSGKKIKLN